MQREAAAVERVFREEYGRLIASLVRRFGDIDIAEEAAGEALVAVLSARGVPTPLAATRLLAPDSLMAPIPPEAFSAAVAASTFSSKYGATVDRASAYEMINARLVAARAARALAELRAAA